jgi:hypothetical protein
MPSSILFSPKDIPTRPKDKHLKDKCLARRWGLVAEGK